jgi:hypothetical protein
LLSALRKALTTTRRQRGGERRIRTASATPCRSCPPAGSCSLPMLPTTLVRIQSTGSVSSRVRRRLPHRCEAKTITDQLPNRKWPTNGLITSWPAPWLYGMSIPWRNASRCITLPIRLKRRSINMATSPTPSRQFRGGRWRSTSCSGERSKFGPAAKSSERSAPSYWRTALFSH